MNGSILLPEEYYQPYMYNTNLVERKSDE